MKHIRRYALLAAGLAWTTGCATLDRPLTLDPKVRTGALENGLTYSVRENKKPASRVELRLAIRAGSVLEEDDQQGLAHFAEHMAFNGTEHFDKHELVDYLESIGMSFGADLNAYTSFDETVYMLQLPTDDEEAVDKGFRILSDWARGVKFEDEEIEKERGVVIEEWRLRRGATQRIRDQQFPVLFADSQYSERMPIGKKDLLETFEPQRARDFYHTWYRPELMTVVAVGTLSPDVMEAKIKEHFSDIPRDPKARERIRYPIPDHEETLVSVVTDPEATSSSVNVYHKRGVDPLETEGDYRRLLIEQLFNTMLNQRFNELRQQAQPPFLAAYSHKSRYTLTKEFYILGANVEDNGVLTGLEAIVTEAERVRRFGFTESELTRTKMERQRAMQKAYAERENAESRSYATAYLNDFIRDTLSPGIEAELELYDRYLDGIPLEEINRCAQEWITTTNRVILVSGPEKADVKMPTEQEILAVFDRVAAADLASYIDDVAEVPLLDEEPQPGRVTSRRHIEELDVTIWELSNGARVILKPTDFKEEQILFAAASPGGHSLASDDDFISASSAAGTLAACGIGDFSRIQLEKKLAGKIAHVAPSISELQEGLSGACSPQDLETFMQLVYLHFTAPRTDDDAFAAHQQRTRASLENRLADPGTVYKDRIRAVMSKHHLRRKPWMPDTVDQMNLDTSLRLYRERFANAGDFTFLFAGRFDPNELEPLVARYLASLPANGEKEQWVDLDIRSPEGAVEETLREGQDKKGQVVLIYSGDMEWSFRERHHIRSMLNALSIRLRESIREELGGTYSIGAYPRVSHYPREEYRIYITFGCDPDQADTLVAAVQEQVEELKTNLVEEINLTKIKQGQLRQRETDLKRNEFWRDTLAFYEWHGEDPLTMLDFEEQVEALTREDIRNAAQKYFNTPNVARFILLPEGDGNGS